MRPFWPILWKLNRPHCMIFWEMSQMTIHKMENKMETLVHSVAKLRSSITCLPSLQFVHSLNRWSVKHLFVSNFCQSRKSCRSFNLAIIKYLRETLQSVCDFLKTFGTKNDVEIGNNRCPLLRVPESGLRGPGRNGPEGFLEVPGDRERTVHGTWHDPAYLGGKVDCLWWWEFSIVSTESPLRVEWWKILMILCSVVESESWVLESIFFRLLAESWVRVLSPKCLELRTQDEFYSKEANYKTIEKIYFNGVYSVFIELFEIGVNRKVLSIESWVQNV